MSYQIDQSGKLESTNRPTVVALANSKSKTLIISAVEKQKLIESIKIITKPKTNYIYRIFATLVYFLLNEAKISRVTIDQEYPGHGSVIKDTLIYLYQKSEQSVPEINFGKIGKKSNAHMQAILVFQKRATPGIVVKAEKVLQALYDESSSRK